MAWQDFLGHNTLMHAVRLNGETNSTVAHKSKA